MPFGLFHQKGSVSDTIGSCSDSDYNSSLRFASDSLKPSSLPPRAINKVITVGGHIFGKLSTGRLDRRSRHASEELYNWDTTHQACSTVSLAPSASTILTEHSLPIPDCGEPFHVPGIPTFEPEPQPQSNYNSKSSDITLVEQSTSSLDTLLIIKPMDAERLTQKKRKGGRWREHLKATYDKLVSFKSPKAKVEEKAGQHESIADDMAENCEDTEDDEDVGASEQEVDGDDDAEADRKEDDNEHPRCDFATIQAIPDSKYQDLFRACHSLLPTTTTQDIRIVDRNRGTYNAAIFVDVHDGEKVYQYVVRIPGHGNLAQWTPEDAYTTMHWRCSDPSLFAQRLVPSLRP
jgi:hypothetical protein